MPLKEETMAGTYVISFDSQSNTLKVGFGASAQNDQIVKDATEALEALNLQGGKLIKVNGPASLPVAMVLAHQLAHRYGTVACFDPKLAKYVVAITHGGDYSLGDLID